MVDYVKVVYFLFKGGVKLESEILKPRQIIEGNFIGCILKDLSLIDDYLDLNLTTDLKMSEAKFYFAIGKALRKLGNKVFDYPSLLAFLEDKSQLKNKFEEFGGYEAIQDLMDVINVENSKHYYDELTKNNILLELNKRGFALKNDWSKIQKMNLEEIHAWYEAHLNEIFMRVEHKVKIENIGITDEDIQGYIEGIDLGISLAKYMPRVNHLLCGLPRKEMTFLSGFQNVGKSTMSYVAMILAIVECGGKAMIVSNEQNITNFKRLLLIHVLCTEFKYYNIALRKLKSGHMSDDDKRMMKLAQATINEKYMPNLLFAETFDYNITTVRRLCKTANLRGCDVFLYDTFKLDSDGDGQAYIKFINDSKAIFQEVKKSNMAGLMTLQNAMSQNQKRVLDLSVFASAKGVSEVASEVLMIRRLMPDEYTGEKQECKVFNYMKDSNGKYTKIKEEVPLNPDKQYIIMFHTKTRNAEVGTQVVYEYNGAFAHFKEIGFASCKPDTKY